MSEVVSASRSRSRTRKAIEYSSDSSPSRSPLASSVSNSPVRRREKPRNRERRQRIDKRVDREDVQYIRKKRRQDREIDDYFHRRQQMNTQDMTGYPLEDIQIYRLDNSMMTDYQIVTDIQSCPPSLEGQESMNTGKLHELKTQITPIYSLWESEIKFFISDYELIDSFRYKSSKYPSFVDHNHKQFSLSRQIKSRDYFQLNEILFHFDQLMPDRPLKINTISDQQSSKLGCIVDKRNIQMKREGSIRQNYIKDSYRISIEQSLENRMRNDKQLKELSHKGYQVEMTDGIGKEKADLVLASGGLQLKNDQQYNYQELYNVKLYFNQLIIDLQTQEIGGSFIFKISDSYYRCTQDILRVLAIYYDNINLVKPLTIRPACSEKYVVCIGFKGISEEEMEKLKQVQLLWNKTETKQDYFDNTDYLHSFIKVADDNDQFSQVLREANQKISEIQIEKLEKGHQIHEKYFKVDTYEKEKMDKLQEHEQLSLQKAFDYCKTYKIPYVETFTI